MFSRFEYLNIHVVNISKQLEVSFTAQIIDQTIDKINVADHCSFALA